jgi:hypothetical protein
MQVESQHGDGLSLQQSGTVWVGEVSTAADFEEQHPPWLVAFLSPGEQHSSWVLLSSATRQLLSSSMTMVCMHSGLSSSFSLFSLFVMARFSSWFDLSIGGSFVSEDCII